MGVRPLVATAGRWLGTGTAGSLLLALGGFGVGALPHAFGREPGWLGVQVLRASTGSRAVCTTLALAGVLLLIGSWLALRTAPARVQLQAAALWGLPLLLAPPLFSRDLYAYAAQGQQIRLGADPYVLGPVTTPGPLSASVASQYAGSASPYGPLFLVLARGVVALVGPHPEAAALLLRLIAVAGLLLVAWSLLRLAPDAPGPALWLGLTNPLVLLHGVGGGHNETLMAGLVLAGLTTRRGTTSARAGGAVLVALGAMVKLPALAALAVLPDRHPPRTLLRQAAAVGVAAVATAALASTVTGLGTGWLRTSVQGVGGPSLLSPAYGLGRLLRGIGVPNGLGIGTTTASLLGVGLAVALLLGAPRLGRLRALGWALVTVACFAPAVQPWYLLWGLLPLAAAGGPRTTRGLAAASVVLCLAILPSGAPVLQGATWGVPVLLAGAAGLLAARRPDLLRRGAARVAGSVR